MAYEKVMTDLQQDETFDSICKQIANARLVMLLLPLLTKSEPRLAARFRSQISSIRGLRNECDKVIKALDEEVHDG